jgi:hypothetical protein
MGDFGKSNFEAKQRVMPKKSQFWTLGCFFSPGFKRRWEIIV